MLLELSSKGDLYVPSKSGTVNLRNVFGGRKPDIIDPLFQGFFNQKKKYSTKEHYYIAQTIDYIHDVLLLPQIEQSDACDIYVALSMLNESGLLEIPAESDETEVIFGRTDFRGVKFVLLVEHEFKRGSDQIHFHARLLDKWSNDKSTLLTRVY